MAGALDVARLSRHNWFMEKAIRVIVSLALTGLMARPTIAAGDAGFAAGLARVQAKALSLKRKAISKRSLGGGGKPAHLQEAPIVLAPLAAGTVQAGANILIPCEYGGHKTRCVLDTAASTTFINYDNFSRDFERVDGEQGRMKGASGKWIKVDVIDIGLLRAGTINLGYPQVFRAHEPAGPRSPFVDGTEGDLGIDVFSSKKSLELDFGQTLELVADEPPSFSANENDMSRSPQGQIIIPVEVGEDVVQALFDTHTSLTVVDIGYIRSHPDEFSQAGTVGTTDGTETQQEDPLYRVKSLTIEGHAVSGAVIGMDLSAVSEILQRRDVKIILGGNFITQFDWYLNLKSDTWAVAPIQAAAPDAAVASESSPVPGSPGSTR